MRLLEWTPQGLYCPTGDFHIDPWRSVPRALITHAHGDHIFPGCGVYVTAEPGRGVLQARLGDEARIEILAYGEKIRLNEVNVSLHPAGHILGSSQVRLENGAVTVVTGDMKRQPDPTCAPFEPLRCDELYLDATFSLPIYRWPDPAAVAMELNAWWTANRAARRTTIVFAYALGKAQRVLAGLEGGPILAHGAVLRFQPIYEAAGVRLPALLPATDENAKRFGKDALVIAPPSAQNTPWMRKFAPFATAFASGWMQMRGAKRRRNVDRGFVMSDHADWNGLLRTVAETGASAVTVMHGFPNSLSRYLTEQGVEAVDAPHRFGSASDAAPLASDEVGA